MNSPGLLRSFARALSNGDCSGFALLTVLWLITALSVVVGLSMAEARVGNQATTNRIALGRGRWAAEACLAIAQARWAAGRLTDTATIDLGRSLRCRWSLDDPSTRVNVNTASSPVLRALGFNDFVLQALLARRRSGQIDDLGEVKALPGFDSAFAGVLTVLGDGRINVSAAPRRVLLALPGMTPEAVDRLLYRRSIGRPISSMDMLAIDMSASSRAALLGRSSDLIRETTFASQEIVVRTEGWVEGVAVRTNVEAFVEPLPEGLAVIGKRVW
jgi:type II secretory pathway component PulK